MPIYTVMKTLHPACNFIGSAVAANDIHGLEDIEEAFVKLVKNSCQKLNETNNKGKMLVPNPASPTAQVVYASLPPSAASNQSAAATDIGNPGQPPPNCPAVHVPAGRQLG